MPSTSRGFDEGRPGYEFKNGKLYHFDQRHVVVIAPWPDPRAWVKRRSHDWRPTRKWADLVLGAWLRAPEPQTLEPQPVVLPSGQMLLPGILGTDQAEDRWALVEKRYRDRITRYIDLVPADILQRVSRYGTRRWHVLNLFARCPGAQDLDRSNPALLYALASNWVFHKPPVTKPMRAARSLVFKRQRLILDWLGFPATESVRRLLSRIVPESLSVRYLLYLRSALEDPFVLGCLRHSHRINTGALQLLTSWTWRRYVTPRLIAEVGQDEHQDHSVPGVIKLLADTINMAELVGHRKRPNRFGSLDRLRAVHGELTAALTPENVARETSLPPAFAAPPFRGTQTILPIRTPDELFQEGIIQKNCCASHAPAIVDGGEYLYRVLRPIRATLSVARNGSRWQADQLFKACNQPVDPATRTALFRELFRSGRDGESQARAPAASQPEAGMCAGGRQLRFGFATEPVCGR